MDFRFPIEFNQGTAVLDQGEQLAVSRTYMALTTIKGERPYRPEYGIDRLLFNTSEQYPRSIEDVIADIEFGDGTVKYEVS